VPLSLLSHALTATKLHRPPVARDAVCRERLLARLDEGSHLPLTLLSAPAGYGKTTLLCQWLDTRDGPTAWLSLDETDNDPRLFLNNIIAALRSAFPGACEDTRVLLAMSELPSIPVLAARLTNDLDALARDLLLALDDYHRIREPAIHQLVSGVLKHPPRSLRLVIATRRDPSLPVGKMRADHLMAEVRLDDLQFTREESGAFLRHGSGRNLDMATVDRLHAGTEGWPVALRLAALALRHHGDVEALMQGLAGGSAAMQRYLVDEILSRQPPALVDCLCETSILDSFCASLVDAVCSRQANADRQIDGKDFVRVVEETGLPCVALDNDRHWYRHHHLFQDLLLRRLKTSRTPAAVATLHRRAAAWLEENGLLEEALEHVLKGGDAVEAGRLVARHGREIKDGEQWHRLLKLLARLPGDVVDRDVELMLLKAWSLDNRLLRAQAWTVVDRVEELLCASTSTSAETARARGEIDALRSCQKLEDGQGELTVDHAERALAHLPLDCHSERGYSTITLALGHQVCGHVDRAFQVISNALCHENLPGGTYQARLMSALAWIQWLEGDLASIKIAAREYASRGRASRLSQSAGAGLLFLGATQYQLNELADAEESLAPLMAERFLGATSQLFVQGGFALASVLQATGRPGGACEIADRLEQGMLRIGNAEFLQHARAFRAELALRQGRVAEAARWAGQVDPEPFRLIYRFYAPEITLAKVLVAEGSAESLRRADKYLNRLEAFLARTHNRIFSIPVLALGALLRSRHGDETGAIERLSRAVALGQPGGAIRVFADLPPEIGRLLNRLELDDEGLRYVGRILAASRQDESPVAAAGDRRDVVDPLTAREVEILALLARRLSNKEIAQQIHLSAGTVKRHTENIYQKLAVHGRRDAVAKAVGLGILRERHS